MALVPTPAATAPVVPAATPEAAPAPAAVPAPAPEAAAEPPAVDPPLGAAGERALQSERDARKKAETDLRAAQARLQTIDDDGKSELVKEQEKSSSAETRATTAEGQLLRLQVAMGKGLPVEMAGRLSGSTKEELEADADTLLPLLTKAPDVPVAPTVPEVPTSPPLDGGVRTAASGPITQAQFEAMPPEQINANWVAIEAAIKTGQLQLK
jgi:hypothetical protein